VEQSKVLFDFAVCIEQFISRFPDEKRIPLTAESVDWNEYIIPYMQGFVTMLLLGHVTTTEKQGIQMLRALAEMAYCLGYERGRQRMPEVLVTGVEDE